MAYTSEMIQMISGMVKSVTVSLWIAKDTNYIIKIEENLHMDMSMMGYTTSMVMSMTLHFTDYNIPVAIELPEEASHAISYEDSPIYQSSLNS